MNEDVFSEFKKEDRVLGKILEAKAAKNGERTFMRYEDLSLSYREINEIANRMGNGFQEIGVTKGDKVSIFLPNCPEFIFTWFGLAKIGALECPVNTALFGELLKYIVNHSDAEVMVTKPQFVERVFDVEADLPNLKTLVVVGTPSPAQLENKRFKIIPFDHLMNSPASDPNVLVYPWDPISIMYTSGTTGPSKGAVLPHAYYFMAGRMYGHARHLGPDKTIFTCLPFFHSQSQILHTMPALSCDSIAAIGPGFDPKTFWRYIRKYDTDQFNYIGAMMVSLINEPDDPENRNNPPTLAWGAPTPWQRLQEYKERFNVARWIDPFGQTEILYMATSYDESLPEDFPIKSVGKPFPYFDIRIVDDNDQELANGSVGEIIVRPEMPWFSLIEYYKNPEATAKAFQNLWFHTGDRGKLDENGYFYFVDRGKDCIRRRGENISSFEVESLMNLHPNVLESAAIAVQSEMSEDEVMIVLLLHDKTRADTVEMFEFAREKMPYYMVPRYYRIVEAFPKTPSLRIEKYKLRQEGITKDTWDRKAAGLRLKKMT